MRLTALFYKYIYQLINTILTGCYSDLEIQALGQYTDLASSVCIIDLGLVFLGTDIVDRKKPGLEAYCFFLLFLFRTSIRAKIYPRDQRVCKAI